MYTKEKNNCKIILSCLNNRVVTNTIRIILEALCVQVLGKKWARFLEWFYLFIYLLCFWEAQRLNRLFWGSCLKDSTVFFRSFCCFCVGQGTHQSKNNCAGVLHTSRCLHWQSQNGARKENLKNLLATFEIYWDMKSFFWKLIKENGVKICLSYCKK